MGRYRPDFISLDDVVDFPVQAPLGPPKKHTHATQEYSSYVIFNPNSLHLLYLGLIEETEELQVSLSINDETVNEEIAQPIRTSSEISLDLHSSYEDSLASQKSGESESTSSYKQHIMIFMFVIITGAIVFSWVRSSSRPPQ